MPKDIHVLLIEDDPYARDLMSLLLNRDWRTRVVGEVGSEKDVRQIIQDTQHSHQRIDAIILDTEVPEDPEWPFRVAAIAHQFDNPPAILCTGTKPLTNTLKQVVTGHFNGYVLKREVSYAIASAITEAAKNGKWVTTPSIRLLALRQRVQLPRDTIILDGTKPVAPFTPREEEIARLAILFNLAHRDLSDELIIRADQVSKYVSSVYDKLGLEQILQGEISPEVYFQDKVVLRHFERILTRVAASKSKRKTSDMATLAFHLLTMPEIRDHL